jgi:hypothetical protein
LVRIHEGFGDKHGMMIELLPIGTEPLQIQLHDFAGQIGNVVRLGDKKPAVVYD